MSKRLDSRVGGNDGGERGHYEEGLRYHLREAKRLVEECGYQRRDPEVMLIEAELAIADGNKEAATKKVQEAKKWIDEKGMYRWDTEVERSRLMLDTRYLVLEQGRG